MKAILVIVILAAIAFALGWLYFRDTGGSFEMIIDKQEVLEDKDEAIEKGREWIDEANRPDTPERAPDTGAAPPAGAPAETDTLQPEGARP